MSLVPGFINITILNPQPFYCFRDIVQFDLNFTNVPLRNSTLGDTMIGLEVRGDLASSDPRGWVGFGGRTRKLSEYQGPLDYYVPYPLVNHTFWLRPFIYFENDVYVNSNLQKSVSSQQMMVKDCGVKF